MSLDSGLMLLSISKKNTSFPSFPPDGDDGLVSCVKMLESTNGIGDFLQEMKKETFENMMPLLWVRCSI